MESKSYIKEQLLTTKIHINPSDIFNTKNIDGLIKFQLKQNIEGYCGKYGYIIPNSLVVIKRSIGTILPNSNSSKIEFNINYKINVILPSINDIYECIIDNITKMGILAYLNTDIPDLNNIKNSPILVIIPQEYIYPDTMLNVLRRKYINTEPPSMHLTSTKDNNPAFAVGGHPNELGHKEIANTLYEHIKKYGMY